VRFYSLSFSSFSACDMEVKAFRGGFVQAAATHVQILPGKKGAWHFSLPLTGRRPHFAAGGARMK